MAEIVALYIHKHNNRIQGGHSNDVVNTMIDIQLDTMRVSIEHICSRHNIEMSLVRRHLIITLKPCLML